jgi:sensor histidine kinase YesM
LNKIAINYRMLGRIEESLSFSFQALRIWEMVNDSVRIAGLLNNIGGIYRTLENYEKAGEYYVRSSEIYTILGIQSGIAQTSNNLGIIYRIQGDYEKALAFYEKSLEIDRQMGNQREVAQSLNNIGILHSLMGDYNTAIESFNTSLAIARQINNLETEAVSLMQLGDVYLLQNRLSLSKKSFEESFILFSKTGNINRKNVIIEKLAEVNKKMGNFQQASNYFEQLLLIRDSVHKEQTKAIVAEIESKYELEKKAQEIENLRQENRIQELKLNENRILTYGFAGFSITILVIALLLIQRNRLYARQKNAELEQKLFRTQMNPHFIFNALNAIQSYIYKSDPLEAGKYLSNFARLIRLVLNNSREDFISLDNEITTLEYYLQLQRLRFNNKFDYKINVDPAIHRELIMVPPMLAQPFIENSIEHGIQHLSMQGNINITFTQSNGWIYFHVEDNGIGVSQSRLLNAENFNKHESVALTITEERLKLLNRSNQQKIELRIEEIVNAEKNCSGTSITFNIPFRTINNKNKRNI